jgi:hypothetical protein
MKRVLIVVAVLAMAASAFAVNVPVAGWLAGGDGTGQYTGSWDYTWDFASDAQGWAFNSAGGPVVSHVSTFGTGATSGTGAVKVTGPGQSAPGWGTFFGNAQLDITTLPMPAGKGTGNIAGLYGGVAQGVTAPAGLNGNVVRWVMEASVWYEGGYGALSGVGIGGPRTGDMKGPYIAGRPAGNQGMTGDDKSWSPNSAKNRSGGTTLNGADGYWVTMQIDYGYTNPGQWTCGYTATPGNSSGWTAGSWHTCVTWDHHAETHPGDINHQLLLGSGMQGMSDFWTATYFDTVKLAVLPAPEPSTIVMLVLGLFGVTRRRRHA